MRVLFVTASFPPDSVGGVELHVRGLAEALAAQGHEAQVFSARVDPSRPHLEVTREVVDGLAVTRLNNTFEDATEFAAMYAHERIAEIFAAELERAAPDVVHVHHLTCLSTLVPERARERGRAVVMTLHDFWMGCPRGQRITAGLDVCPEIRLERCVPCLRELWPHLLGRGGRDGTALERDAADRAALEEYHAAIRHALLACDALLTPSRFMKRMYEAYGIPGERIEVVENGLDPGPFADVRRRPHAGPLRVGYIGSVLPSKGVHVLVEAVRRLGDPARFTLDVHGAVLPFHNDRTYGERLEAARRGAEGSIRLHGAYPPEQLAPILESLDVLVVPSLWYEAYGLTIREAFLARVPVVVSDHGAMAEAVEHGVTGLRFDAGDPDALAAALRRLADEPSLGPRLAAAAADRVRSVDDAATQVLGVYERVLPAGDRR